MTDDTTDDGDEETFGMNHPTTTPGRPSGLVQKAPAVVEAEVVEERTEVETREGTLYANPGDVLITGVEGEVYPCDPVIFAKTYVPHDTDSLRLFREAVPDGVEIEFEDTGDLTIPTGVYFDGMDDLDEEEKERAVRFVRDYARSMPTIRPGVPDELLPDGEAEE